MPLGSYRGVTGYIAQPTTSKKAKKYF